MCEYSYYDETNSRKPIYCNLNDRPCIYSKYCTKVGKFIPNDDMENCFMATEERNKNIPEGANYVRFTNKGKLYVEYGNRVVAVTDTIGNDPTYVYIRQVNGEYQVSATPFVAVEERKEEKPKRNTRTKKNA